MEEYDTYLWRAACELCLREILIGTVSFWERIPKSVDAVDDIIKRFGFVNATIDNVPWGHRRELRRFISVDCIMHGNQVVAVYIAPVTYVFSEAGKRILFRNGPVNQHYNGANADESFEWSDNGLFLRGVPGKTKRQNTIRLMYYRL